ncbi:MBG domain-containing protein [uncultured Polaribacter sp.]|uniref:MBG domain-containing protein n=1 Tax=uncultured Polaribacter sp. TaxID=174711 RepID=UPI002639DF8A|nr:MBG domain-containing protein [uncultured Polaribacter sp.]
MTPKFKANLFLALFLICIFCYQIAYTTNSRNNSNFIAFNEVSDFENSFDGWSNITGDILNWTNGFRNTPSAGTGPQNGAGSTGNYFMFVEMSGFTEGDNAYLQKNFDLRDQLNAQIALDYHMFSRDAVANIGTFNVSISENGGTSFNTVFTRTGNQGSSWLSQTIDLSAYDGKNIIIRFEAIRANSWQGDISIDNVVVTSDDNPDVNLLGFSFENSLDGWSNPTAEDDFNWLNRQNNTPSAGTGPQNGASEGSWFMFVEASNPRINGDTAYLEREFDFTGQESIEMSLDYHMYSSGLTLDVGTFSILISNDGGNNYTNIFSRSGNRGIDWNSETLDLSAYNGQIITIRFEAIIANSFRSDIAIDNVVLISKNITGIPITVTAEPQTKEIGQTDPSLTYTITSGALQPGDTLTGSLTREEGESIGSYTILRGTLNNPNYSITYISAKLTITDKDTDSDGYLDGVDIDDDNDGILDTDEVCVISGAASSQSDRITFSDNNFEVFTIGGNGNGLGYQESGFQAAAFNRGMNLTVTDTNNDFTFTPNNPAPGTATSSTGTFSNGSLTYTSNATNIANRENLFTRGTIAGSEVVFIQPSTDLTPGEVYSVNINFNTPVHAFSFDIIDILDTGNDLDPNTILQYEIFADNNRIGYFQYNAIGAGNVATVDFFDNNNISRGQMLVGDSMESSIGFISNNDTFSSVSLIHNVISGSPASDFHFISKFAWSTQPQSCFASDADFDGDGISNDKDLDSDNDGIPDNIEAQSTIDYIQPNGIFSTSGIDTAYGTGLTAINTDESGNADYVDIDADDDGIFDILESGAGLTDADLDGKTDGTVGNNGIDNTLTDDNYEDVNANINNPTTLQDTDGDVLTIGDVDYRDSQLSGIPLVTQILHTSADRVIEITNIHPTNTILANTIKLSLYTNTSGDQTNVVPSATYTVTSDLAAGASVLITNSGSSYTGLINNPITNFSDGDDILLLTHPNGLLNGTTAWRNRYETSFDINNTTSYVRADQVLSPNQDFTTSEWIAFVDDNLDPYRDLASGGPERHPHDPLISEISNADPNSNLSMGVHRTNPTSRTGGNWSNGVPDRTRRVVIAEDYETTSKLSAKELTINSGRKLTINNNLLVVTDDITFNDTNSEIRLADSAQLIQTHNAASKINGSGKVYIDQNSESTSIYRYNYMSSPVVTSGNSFTLNDVLKDGTNPTSSSSSAVDINFISGQDGDTTSPISIASEWIYTFASADGLLSNWVQKLNTNPILNTDGFTLKGPGAVQNYTFTGIPNDGNLTTAVGGNEFYLLGNPFSSAISVKKFIEDNINSINGTLYFWQHAGEVNESEGHTYTGYIGGYSTRNIAMGVVANDESLVGAFNITLEAEDAQLNLATTTNDFSNDVVLIDNTNESITFPRIARGIESLKITYRSLTGKNLTLSINGIENQVVNFPIQANYTVLDIPICLEQGNTVTFSSNDNDTIFIDNMILEDDDGQISCSFTSGSGFTYTEPGEYIPVAQGFFVGGDQDGGPIVFNNSQREYIQEGTQSVFFKSLNKQKQNTLPVLKLSMEYRADNTKLVRRQIGISFNKNNSFHYNNGYDSHMFNLNNTDFYWKFPQDNNALYVIAGIGEISKDLSVPLEVVVDKNLSITFQIDQWNLIEQEVFLYDKITDQYYKMNDELVKITLDKGTYSDRFFIRFYNQNNTLKVDNYLANSISTYYNKASKEIIVKVNKSIEIEKVKLFSILGQEIGSWKLENTNLDYKIKTNTIAHNVYLVKINTDKGSITKKIIIN